MKINNNNKTTMTVGILKKLLKIKIALKLRINFIFSVIHIYNLTDFSIITANIITDKKSVKILLFEIS